VTRDDVLNALHATRRELNEVLAAMTLDDLSTPGVAGDWSVTEILMHLAWYASEEAGLISEDPAYEASPFWSVPQDERNEVIRDHFRSHDAARAREQLDESFARTVDAVTRLTDDDLASPGRFPGTSATHLPWQDIADSTFEHEREHIGMIRDWMARRSR
jgi:uncharacterized protein (TIGR03083 family)